jgi:hypothetical protein
MNRTTPLDSGAEDTQNATLSHASPVDHFLNLSCHYPHFLFHGILTMEALQTLRETLTVFELLKGLHIAFLLGRILAWSTRKDSTANNGLWSITSPRREAIQTAAFFALYLAGRSWLALVDRYVPEPYLVSATPCTSHSMAC